MLGSWKALSFQRRRLQNKEVQGTLLLAMLRWEVMASRSTRALLALAAPKPLKLSSAVSKGLRAAAGDAGTLSTLGELPSS